MSYWGSNVVDRYNSKWPSRLRCDISILNRIIGIETESS